MARFENGWVKLHRRAALGDINSSYNRGGLFMALISMARIQESTAIWNGKPRTLERGEIVTSIKELAELGDVDRRTVERHLNYLALRGTISYEKCPKGTFIKLLNFDLYQGDDAGCVKPQRNDMPNGMLNDVAQIKERKKERRKEEPLWPFFEQLCRDYPIKVSATKSGFARFKEHVKNETDFSKMMLHLARYKKHLQKNPWKPAKQSIETFIGTERSGHFWLQWDSDDAGEETLKRAADQRKPFVVPE